MVASSLPSVSTPPVKHFNVQTEHKVYFVHPHHIILVIYTYLTDVTDVTDEGSKMKRYVN